MPNWRKVVVADSAASFGSVTTPSNVVNDFTASYAINASTTAINSGTVIAITPASTTWTLNHSVNERYPIVTCWESGSNEIIQPDTVRSIDINTVEVTFTTPIEGFANVSRAGHVISGSNGVTLWTQLAGPANVTASGLYGGFTGSLQGTASAAISSSYSQYATTASYAINAPTAASASYAATASYALASLTASYAVSALSASHLSTTASNALTSSYSGFAASASWAATASYWSGSIQNATSASFATSASWAPDTTFPFSGSARITGSLTITGSVAISGSLTMQDVIVAPYLSIANYSGDAEAAAAGIPLWGIYRTGNMLVVRMT
jgi:hypothetical protein